jgi:ketosteroid isomerase-like protein
MREVFARYFRGDRDGAAALFAADAIFRYPAPGPLHGDYRGRGGVRKFWAAQDRFGGRVFAPRLVDLAAARERVFLLVEAGDERHHWQRVVVYEVADGAVRMATVFEADPVQARAYFTSAALVPDTNVDAAGAAP